VKSQPQIKVQLTLPPATVSFSEKMYGLWQLVRADKPVGVLLLFWPTLWALWVAGEGRPNWYVTLVFILVVLLLRSTACAVKGYADRRINMRMIHGCRQPVASGIVQPREAIAVMIMMLTLAIYLLTSLSLTTLMMAAVTLVMAYAYMFLRRFTYFSQLITAMVVAWVVPVSYVAIGREMDLSTVVLFLSAFLWVMVYELEHAMAHRTEDMINGVKSIALFLEDKDVLVLGILQILLMGLFIWLGFLTGRSWFYFVASALTALFLMRQQHLIFRDHTAGAFAAYLNNNCYGMTMFLIILGDYVITA